MGKYLKSCTIWAVNFDEVLHNEVFPHIGTSNDDIIKFLIEKQKSGDKIILIAYHIDQYEEDVIKWSNDHNLFYDAVNENIQEIELSDRNFGYGQFGICADAFIAKNLTQTTVKIMGFTDKLIKELLPDPELVDNPHYLSGAKMKLWRLSDVEIAMKNSMFQDVLMKKEKRKKSAAKAVITRKAKLESDADEFIKHICIKRIDIDLLRKRTIKAKQNWCFAHDDYSDIYPDNENTVMRWMVNYIRHEMTHYDEQLYRMKGKTGVHEMHDKIHDLILDKIAIIYPELAEECVAQKCKKEE